MLLTILKCLEDIWILSKPITFVLVVPVQNDLIMKNEKGTTGTLKTPENLPVQLFSS